MRTFLLTLTPLLSASMLFACTQESYSPPTETMQEVSVKKALSNLLHFSQYQELDAKANSLQYAYERGKLSDVSLLHIYRAFYDSNPSLERQYAQWINAYPNSYAAHLAYGIYLRTRAYDARGCEYIQNTSRQQIATMESLANKAISEFNQSVPLAAKPILSYHALLGLAMLNGDAATARTILESSCQIDSHNYIVRYKYLTTLQTRWGGSLQAMLHFRKEAEQAGLTWQQLSYFDDMITSERVWLAQNSRP